MDYKIYPELSKAARGIIKADFVVKNGMVLNVFTEEFEKADIAVSGGMIVGIGRYSGAGEIDAEGKYVVPGFIDSHLHLESTLVQPFELIGEALKYGTTSFIVDPHESANVAGPEGIDYILSQTEAVAANVYVMVPSCVPATSHEDNGYILTAGDMKNYLGNPRILGLGEVMDSLAVINGESGMMDKLALFQSMTMDGHAPFLPEKELAAYVLAGIRTDHECCDYNYAKNECKNGMYVLIREGSAAKNLEAIVNGIVRENAATERYCFCTDDKHIEDIREYGDISYNIKKAIGLGIAAAKAFKMASFNPACCYGLKHLGALAPGFQADMVLLDSLEDVAVSDVYFKGKNIKEYGRGERAACPEHLKRTINVKGFSREKLKLRISRDEKFPVIEILPGQIVTKKVCEEVSVDENGLFIAGEGYNKIAVVERHRGTGKTGVGILKGFGIRNGAIASSVSHDSHNITVVGDNDDDMAAAVEELIKNHGGYTIVSGGIVKGVLPLPIMGLMSDAGYEEVERKLGEMIEISHQMGVGKGIDPFINLSFMALTVIPEIRITARGIYETEKGGFY